MVPARRVGVCPGGVLSGCQRCLCQALTGFGAPKSFSLYERQEMGDDIIYGYEVVFPDKTRVVHLRITPDDKVSVFRFAAKP